MTQLHGQELAAVLDRLAGEQPERETDWQPTLWPADAIADDPTIRTLLERGEVVAVHDQLDGQLRELVETRNPGRQPDFERAIPALLNGTHRAHYGTWVYYPWLRRLVRVLPKAEFREIRTSRNRNKITGSEQAKLLALDLAIIGLSVGRATAITLALEGIGGHIRLADFDELSLSNMNRLRAGVHEIGVNKAVLTARALFEIDPYLEVSIWPQGISPTEIDDFLTAGGRVDILFEECDDLQMKIRTREAARRHRIPVLMETSDRGMLDIERFDLEPDRPLFHGLVGELDPDSLRGLSTYEKIPTVAKIIGLSTLSKRMAASLIDVDATLKTWPQLASAVALGGALNADAARRLALGGLRESGRFHVDLEAIIREGQAPTQPSSAAELDDAPALAALPALVPGRGPVTHDELVALLAWAERAPSGGNSQPWRFAIDGATLSCRIDTSRTQTVLDDGLLAAYLACGAAAEHVAIAAPSLGLAVEIHELPDPTEPELAWRATFVRRDDISGALADDLAAQIPRRCTNRKRSPRVALERAAADALAHEAALAGASLELVEDDARLASLARILARSERQRLLSARLHRDMFAEIRWTTRAALDTRDGLDYRTLELNPTERAGMALLSSWEVMQTLRDVGGGEGLDRPTREAVDAATAIGLVSVEGVGPSAYVRGGRALARVWLRASALGLAMQPMSAVLFLLQHIARTGGSALDPDTVAVFGETAQQLDGVFARRAGTSQILMFRLAQTKPPSARSLRRRVTDTLDPP